MAAYVTIQGRLTRDPQQRQTNNGSPVVDITVAVNDGTNNNNQVTFYQAGFFGNAGNAIMQYLKKGDPVIVTGELRTRLYQPNRQDIPNTILEIARPKFEFVMGRPRQENNQPATNQGNGGNAQLPPANKYAAANPGYSGPVQGNNNGVNQQVNMGMQSQQAPLPFPNGNNYQGTTNTNVGQGGSVPLDASDAPF